MRQKKFSDESTKRQQSWLDAVQGHILSAVSDNVTDHCAPEVDEERGCEFKAARYDLNLKVDIKRELIQAVKDDYELRDQEMHDSFLSEEAHRLATTASSPGRRGRPPKQRSEQLMEASCFLRDKSTKINDAMQRSKRAFDDFLQDARRQIGKGGSLPEDLETLANRSRVEVKEACDKIGELEKEIKALKVEELLAGSPPMRMPAKL